MNPEQDQNQTKSKTSRVAQPFMTVASESDEEVHYSHPGWSWGGFMFNIFFAACLKRYWFLLWFGALLVPIVNLFVPFVLLGLMIYFGVKGRELAARSAVFTSKQQYIGFMKGIDHAGKCMFFLSLAGLLVMVVIMMIIATIVLRELDSSREAAHRALATATARSLVPVLTICRGAGGSVNRDMPQEGDSPCSTPVLDDTYPAVRGGWRYVSAEDVGMDDFLLILSREEEYIRCTKKGCAISDFEGVEKIRTGAQYESSSSLYQPFYTRAERSDSLVALAHARSMVPVMTICHDAGGSVEAYSPQPGDVVCSDTSVIEDTYMVLPEGWRYGPVMDDELRMFVFSVTDSKTVIECDMNGCGEVTMYSE